MLNTNPIISNIIDIIKQTKLKNDVYLCVKKEFNFISIIIISLYLNNHFYLNKKN